MSRQGSLQRRCCLTPKEVMDYKGMTHIKGAALGYLQNICAAAMATAPAH